MATGHSSWHGADFCAIVIMFKQRDTMRRVNVHPEKSINCTERALDMCVALNSLRVTNPKISFREMAEIADISESAAKAYYYGIHYYNRSPFAYTQIRAGARCPVMLPEAMRQFAN